MAIIAIQIPPSTNLAAVTYDEDKQDLTIEFHKGSYVYHKVPRNVATGFTTSGLGAGDYFRANVLNQYQFDRLG